MIPKQECESEQGNNTPHKPTGWEPVTENLRKIWMKLERPPRAETGPLAVDPGGEGERKEPQNPTSIFNKRTEHGQWEEFSMERRDDSMMKKVDAVLLPCPYTRGKVQLRLLPVKTLHREGGNTNTFHLIHLERPSEPSKPAWNAPSAMEGHQETSKNINRLRKDGGETGEQGGPRREMHPAWWAQGMWAQGTGCPLDQWATTDDFMLLRSNIKFKHCRNVNTALKSAKTLTEAKYYPIKFGLYINLSYTQRIVNSSYI